MKELSDLFLNSLIKMKNEKTVFCFPFFYEKAKQKGALKIQIKNLLNIKVVVNCLNFVFHKNKI